jgi:pantoate--beta-alanine ligase
VVSIFVNPTQFARSEDFDRYPRDEARDLAVCEREGVDVVWAPPVDEVYPPGLDVPAPDPGPVGDLFEGAARPGHFAGVLQVVRRLLEVTGPCCAYFGDKDAQQLFLVRRMVATDPGLAGYRIVGCPTVRAPDGLAISSRNAYLNEEERAQAGCLFLALTEAAERAHAGEPDPTVLVAAMAREVGATPLARLDYAAVVEEATFRTPERIGSPARALLAVRFPSARLIDTLPLPPPALDRPVILEAIASSLRGVSLAGDDDEVGAARVVVEADGVLAGIPVVKEVFGRFGVRTRALVEEGSAVAPRTAVVEVGGALAAIRGAAPVALTWLQRLSAVATGAAPPAEGDPLDAYAAWLSRPDAVREAGPSFTVEFLD